MKKTKRNLSVKSLDNLWGYTFVIIPIVGALIFTIYPFLMSVYASFTSWPLGQSLSNAKFVGLQNYITMFSSELFWKSLGNTFFYMIGIPIGLVISIFLANMMNRNRPYDKVFRVIYYTPVITSIVAISFVFQQMFMSDGGSINNFLRALGMSTPPNWLSNPYYTKWVIIIMTVWKGLGTSIILFIAGMNGISSGLYEAAKIDGANWWQSFRKITIPLLKPVIFYLIVTSVIGGAQMYVEPRLIFTANGPANSTFTTVIHLYDYTFVNSKAGYGSAVAVVIGAIVFILTAIQFYVNGRSDRVEKKKARS